MTGFKRERRYVVLKIRDVQDFLPQPLINHLNSIAEEVEAGRILAGKQPLECVVIENDWPEYESAWAAIEARMTPNS